MASRKAGMAQGEGVVGHEKYYGASAANAAVTVSTVSGSVRKITSVMIHFSAGASVTCTITLNSGVGAAYDTLLASLLLGGAADAVWYPSGDLEISDDDVLDVYCPAAGVGVTSQVQIYTEVLS